MLPGCLVAGLLPQPTCNLSSTRTAHCFSTKVSTSSGRGHSLCSKQCHQYQEWGPQEGTELSARCWHCEGEPAKGTVSRSTDQVTAGGRKGPARVSWPVTGGEDKCPAWGPRCWHQDTPHMRMLLSWSRRARWQAAKAETDCTVRGRGRETPGHGCP